MRVGFVEGVMFFMCLLNVSSLPVMFLCAGDFGTILPRTFTSLFGLHEMSCCCSWGFGCRWCHLAVMRRTVLQDKYHELGL